MLSLPHLEIPEGTLPTEQEAPRALPAGHWETEHNAALLMKVNIIKIDSVLAKEIRVSDGMCAQYHSKALLILS